MATLAHRFAFDERPRDVLSGTPRASAIDRWIFVFMAAWFIAVVLAGFIPDSIMKVGMVQDGERLPFPLVMHAHAVLMGSFLLLLLAQAWLMATGRRAMHMQLGIAGVALAALLVVVGLILAPTMYHEAWNALQAAPPQARDLLTKQLAVKDDILLVQMRIGILFPTFLIIALRARGADAGLHKRMMFLATAMAMPAGLDRIPWLPSSLPASPLTVDLYPLLILAPLFVWDVLRNHHVHRAYWIWLAINLPFAIALHSLWDTPWWHHAAKVLMDV